MDRQLEKEQAWDEYCSLTSSWENILILRQRLNEQISDWIDEEKTKYEKNIAPLMPYVFEKLEEIKNLKAGEELREMGVDYDAKDEMPE